MNDEFILRQEDLVENPTARIPICLVLDVSTSMSGDPIKELQSGVDMFFEAVRNDPVAQFSAEICVVTFGGIVKKELDFASIARQTPPILETRGDTPMGSAVKLALDLLEARKTEYRNAGVDYYQPWIVLMTDGQPTDDIQASATRIAALDAAKKVTIFPIAIGTGANLTELARLSPGRPPLRLKGLNFREFFVWLSQSISHVSQSTPGEKVKLDLDGIKAWGQV